MGILWSKSGQVEFDNNGDRAAGAIANFFVGGTTTPFAVYEDSDESTVHDEDVVTDANGRWPAVFIPFTDSYDVQVTASGGTQLYYYEEIQNIDAVTAIEDAVAAEDLIQTGDWKFSTRTGDHAGFVRANGRTIGNAASGATERANADTSDLFTFLWNGHADAILAVSTGRGASAAADYAANKTIALFNARSAVLVGADDMGNTAAGLGYGGAFTTGSAIIGGSVGGANTHTLVAGEHAAHTHGFSTTSGSGGGHTHTGTTATEASHSHSGTTGGISQNHTHAINITSAGQSVDHTHQATTRNTITNQAFGGSDFVAWDGATVGLATGGTSNDHTHAVIGNTGNPSADHTHTFTTGAGSSHSHTFTTASDGAHTHSISGTSDSQGSGTAHNNMPRHVVGTWFVKL